MARAVSRAPAPTPARRVAFAVVRRVFEQAAYADRALRAEAAGLDARDRALATQLAFGTVQRRATLDWVARQLSHRPPDDLDPPVLAALRLGLFQLLFLDGVAPHAAVNESVTLAGRGGGLVNAVLRRATREGGSLLASLRDDTPAHAAIAHSVPEWLAGRWFAELGAAEARALLAAVNRPAESALRVNTLAARRDEVLARLPVAARTAGSSHGIDLPEGVVIEAAFDVHGSELFAAGMVMPQSRASMSVARMLGPAPGARVLDLCAAPGAKTTHLAALMDGAGDVIAVERHPGRAASLGATCRRMRASTVSVKTDDARHVGVAPPFDAVLLDPPCSGLGTLASRPDLRWRTSPERIAELSRLQADLLDHAAVATRPGGALVYSVCTISRAEGAEQVERFRERQPEWTVEREEQFLPHRDGTDGFYVARLRRESG